MELLTSRTWAEINLKYLEKNVEILRNQISKQTKFLAIVKANAYGHGLIEIAKKLEECKVDMFGVATLEEAILVLEQSSPEFIDLLCDNIITQTIENIEIAQKFSKFAKNKNKTVKIHIKINTDMGRLGIFWPDNEELKKKTEKKIKNMFNFPGLKIEGVFTHLAKTTDINFSQNQIKIFKEALKYLKNLGLKFNIIHATASAAIFNYQSTHFDVSIWFIFVRL